MEEHILVDNAIKYTSVGSHISVTSKSENGMTVLSVLTMVPVTRIRTWYFKLFYTGSSSVADRE